MDKPSTAESRKSIITSQLIEQNNNTNSTDNTYKENNCLPVAGEIVKTTDYNDVETKEAGITSNCPRCEHRVNFMQTVRCSTVVLGVWCPNCYHVFTTGEYEHRKALNKQIVPKAHPAKTKSSPVQKQLKRPKIVHIDIANDGELDVPSFTSASQQENNTRLSLTDRLPSNGHFSNKTSAVSEAEVAKYLNNQSVVQQLNSRATIEKPLNSINQVIPDMSPPILTQSPYLTVFQGNLVRPSNNHLTTEQSEVNYMVLTLVPSDSQPPVKEPITNKIDDSDDECMYSTETNYASKNKSKNLNEVSDIEKRIVKVDDGCEEREFKEEIVWLEEAEEVDINLKAPYPVAISSALNRTISVDLQDKCDNDGNVDLTNDDFPEIMCNDIKRDDSNRDKHDGTNDDERGANDNGFLRIEAVTTLSKEQFTTLTNDAVLTGYEKDRHLLEKKENNFGCEFLKFLDNKVSDKGIGLWEHSAKRRSQAITPVQVELPYPNLIRGFAPRTNETDIVTRFKCAITPLKVLPLVTRWGVAVTTVQKCLKCCASKLEIGDKYLATVVSNWQILRCSYCISMYSEIRISTSNLKCSNLHSSVDINDGLGHHIKVEGSSKENSSAEISLIGKAYVESESWSHNYNTTKSKYPRENEMIYIIYVCNDCLPSYVGVTKYASVQSREIYFKCLVCGKLWSATNAVMLRLPRINCPPMSAECFELSVF